MSKEPLDFDSLSMPLKLVCLCILVGSMEIQGKFDNQFELIQP